MTMKVSFEEKVLSRNDRIAAEVRRHLTARGILAINLIGSPGSGKTSLVERTAAWCHGRVAAAALTAAVNFTLPQTSCGAVTPAGSISPRGTYDENRNFCSRHSLSNFFRADTSGVGSNQTRGGLEGGLGSRQT